MSRSVWVSFSSHKKILKSCRVELSRASHVLMKKPLVWFKHSAESYTSVPEVNGGNTWLPKYVLNIFIVDVKCKCTRTPQTASSASRVRTVSYRAVSVFIFLSHNYTHNCHMLATASESYCYNRNSDTEAAAAARRCNELTGRGSRAHESLISVTVRWLPEAIEQHHCEGLRCCTHADGYPARMCVRDVASYREQWGAERDRDSSVVKKRSTCCRPLTLMYCS